MENNSCKSAFTQNHYLFLHF